MGRPHIAIVTWKFMDAICTGHAVACPPIDDRSYLRQISQRHVTVDSDDRATYHYGALPPTNVHTFRNHLKKVGTEACWTGSTSTRSRGYLRPGI